MAECSEIALMLGAFEDGELEPHEYQSVAVHLARCERCTAELSDYSTIGRELRTAVSEPSLNGFVAGVMSRIEHLPVPFTTRIAHFFDRLSDHLGSGLGMAAAAAAAAAITVFLAAPYAQYFTHRGAAIPQTASRQIARSENPVVAAPVQLASAPAEPSGNAQDSQAVISRLESEIPSVAVWSEPQHDTTVIWLPDQQQ